MALYKLCRHRGRARDRCRHAWWGAFQFKGRLHRVSLERWASQTIHSKAEADAVFDRFKDAIRTGLVSSTTESKAEPASAITFGRFAEIYAER